MIVFGPLGSNWRRKWQPTQLFLSWRIPWTEEPGALESQRVGHNWSDLARREVIRIKWDSTGKALIWWNRNPYKRMRRHQRAHFLSLSPLLTLNMYRLRKGYLRTQKEHGHLQTRKRALTRNQVLQAEIELKITHMTNYSKGTSKHILSILWYVPYSIC